jgi:hypothetical protein
MAVLERLFIPPAGTGLTAVPECLFIPPVGTGPTAVPERLFIPPAGTVPTAVLECRPTAVFPPHRSEVNEGKSLFLAMGSICVYVSISSTLDVKCDSDAPQKGKVVM